MKEAGKKLHNRTIRLNFRNSCPELFRDLDIQIILTVTRKIFLGDFSSSNIAYNKLCAGFCILFQEVHNKR